MSRLEVVQRFPDQAQLTDLLGDCDASVRHQYALLTLQLVLLALHLPVRVVVFGDSLKLILDDLKALLHADQGLVRDGGLGETRRLRKALVLLVVTDAVQRRGHGMEKRECRNPGNGRSAKLNESG